MSRPSPPARFRLSGHLDYLFGELPLEARFAAARDAGFRAIELADPYRLSAAAFRALCRENGLEVAQIVLPNPDLDPGLKGLAALPGRQSDFDEALAQSIAFATAADCRLIHPMSGTGTSTGPAPDWAVYLANLERACVAAAKDGLSVIVEAISRQSVPGYFIDTLGKAKAALNEIGAPNLLLSLDTYHAAAMGVHLPSFIEANAASIGHVQLADWPSRHEPGSGDIDFAASFTALRKAGYTGYVGLEYFPTDGREGGFGWLECFDPWLEPLYTG